MALHDGKRLTRTGRANFQPAPTLCKQCGHFPQIKGRPDGLCANCGHYADRAVASVQKDPAK